MKIVKSVSLLLMLMLTSAMVFADPASNGVEKMEDKFVFFHTNIHVIEGIVIVGFLAFSLWFFFKYSRGNEFMRDEITDMNAFKAAAAKDGIANPKAPFSLSRTQMAVWTIVIANTMFFYFFAGVEGFSKIQLDQSLLILLGISAGTTLFANGMDGAQQNYIRHQNSYSEGFWTDLVSDQHGICVHRFQNVLFNIIGLIGFIFAAFHIDEIYSAAKMNEYWSHIPTVNTQLLLLMGISSSAYLTMRVSENKTCGYVEIKVADAKSNSSISLNVDSLSQVNIPIDTGYLLLNNILPGPHTFTITKTPLPTPPAPQPQPVDNIGGNTAPTDGTATAPVPAVQQAPVAPVTPPTPVTSSQTVTVIVGQISYVNF